MCYQSDFSGHVTVLYDALRSSELFVMAVNWTHLLREQSPAFGLYRELHESQRVAVTSS